MAMRGATNSFLRRVVLLLLLQFHGAHGQAGGVVTRDLQRERNTPVVDLTHPRPTLNRREQRRLSKRIQSIPEDIQIVIANEMETGDSSITSSKEMATHLFNQWPMGKHGKNGSYLEHHGILILVLMDQNRFEIEFGDGLGRWMDASWCQEMLITQVVPWFREGKYARGLEEAVNAIDRLLLESIATSTINNRRVHETTSHRRHRKGLWAAVLGFFGYSQYPHIRKWWRAKFPNVRKWWRAQTWNNPRPPKPQSPPPPPPASPPYRRSRRPRRYYDDDDYRWDRFAHGTRFWSGHSAGPKTPTNVNIFSGIFDSKAKEPETKPPQEVRTNILSPDPVEATPATKTRLVPQTPKAMAMERLQSSSSGWGGGASWGSRKASTTTSATSTSSSNGGGASWSSSPPQKQETNKASGNGGGASW